MSSAREDVQDSYLRLMGAEKKILELEEELKEATEGAETHKKIRQQLLEDLRKVERDRDIYKESHSNAHKAFGVLQDVILGKDSVTETYDDLLAPVQDLVKFRSNTLYCLQLPGSTETDKAISVLKNSLFCEAATELDSLRNLEVSLRDEIALHKKNIEGLQKGIERLKHKSENFSFSSLLDAYKVVKKEYRELKDSAQFESDTKLSEVRKVLGAKNRNADRPHETALQAAKRVMEELQDLKKRHANTVKSSTGRIYTPPEGYIVVKEDLLKQTITETIQDTVRACGEEFIRKLI